MKGTIPLQLRNALKGHFLNSISAITLKSLINFKIQFLFWADFNLNQWQKLKSFLKSPKLNFLTIDSQSPRFLLGAQE